MTQFAFWNLSVRTVEQIVDVPNAYRLPNSRITGQSLEAEQSDVRSSRILGTAHVPTWRASMTYTSWCGLSRPCGAL